MIWHVRTTCKYKVSNHSFTLKLAGGIWKHGVCFVLKCFKLLPNLNLHLIQTVNVKYVQWVLENFVICTPYIWIYWTVKYKTDMKCYHMQRHWKEYCLNVHVSYKCPCLRYQEVFVFTVFTVFTVVCVCLTGWGPPWCRGEARGQCPVCL